MVDQLSDRSLPTHVFAGIDRLQRRAGGEIGAHFDTAIPGMRGSFGLLLGILPADGARASELADLARISKQAVGKRLEEMVELGWVTMETDPADRRAKVVRRTPAGDAVRDTTDRAIAAMEREWEAEIGPRSYATFKAVLDELGQPR